MCLFRTINLCPALFSSRVKGKKDYLRCELVVVVAVFGWYNQELWILFVARIRIRQGSPICWNTVLMAMHPVIG